MSFVNKTLAVIMLLLSILIFLELFEIFSLNFYVDKLLIVAVLMIILQVSSLIHLKLNQQAIRVINIVTFVIFTAPALVYLLQIFLGLSLLPFAEGYFPLILTIMALAEALYALH